MVRFTTGEVMIQVGRTLVLEVYVVPLADALCGHRPDFPGRTATIRIADAIIRFPGNRGRSAVPLCGHRKFLILP